MYWYLKEGVISSKLEAGNWSCKVLPQDFSKTVRNVVKIYTGEDDECPLTDEKLISLRDFLEERVQGLLQK